MKIAIDGSLLGARFSGVERSVGQTVAALARAAGPDDELLLFVGDGFDDYAAAYLPEGLEPGGRLRVVRCALDNRARGARLWWQQVVLPRLVQQQRADVFHGPAYVLPLALDLPSVLTVYDLLALDRPEFATTSNRLHYRLTLPASLRHATRILAPSEDTRRAIARRVPAVAERCRVAPLGVESRFFEVAAEAVAAVRERFRLPQRYLLWVGNVEPKKNLGVLLRALELLKLRDRQVPKLVLAGQLSWGTHELMKTFLEAGLQSAVTFLGRVGDAELPGLYGGACGFLFPSLAEGFGLPPLEALAAGLPTAVANAGALPEVVGEAALLVEPGDVEGWAAALEQLADDEPLRADLAGRAPGRAAEFSWDRTADAIWRIYREVVA
jgi:glycosyltransferase involved in cell wall biosynthesis